MSGTKVRRRCSICEVVTSNDDDWTCEGCLERLCHECVEFDSEGIPLCPECKVQLIAETIRESEPDQAQKETKA